IPTLSISTIQSVRRSAGAPADAGSVIGGLSGELGLAGTPALAVDGEAAAARFPGEVAEQRRILRAHRSAQASPHEITKRAQRAFHPDRMANLRLRAGLFERIFLAQREQPAEADPPGEPLCPFVGDDRGFGS